MDPRESATAFAEIYGALYRRFYRRVRPTAYRPSLEALAVLEHLDRTGPITVMEAAAHFERSQSSTSELFRRLEDRGLLAAVVDERDRRRRLFWLTDEGLAALDDTRQVLSINALEEAMSKLSAEERASLVSILERLSKQPIDYEGWDE